MVIFIITIVVSVLISFFIYRVYLKKLIADTKQCRQSVKEFKVDKFCDRDIITAQGISEYKKLVSSPDYTYNMVSFASANETPAFSVRDGFNLGEYSAVQTVGIANSVKDCVDKKIALSWAEDRLHRYDQGDIIISNNRYLVDFVEKMSSQGKSGA